MNAWLLASVVLLFCLVPCGVLVFRGQAIDRLIGLEMAGMVETLLMVTLAEGMHRASLYDLALALGLLAFGGGLVFVRFFERWL